MEVALCAADDAAVGQHSRVAPRALGKRVLQLPVVIDQPSHARNRAVGRDGDTLAVHPVRIVGPLKRSGIRRAELREMKTVEDLAAGGDPVGLRRQLRRFDERLRALLPHPVAIPFRFAALDVDRVGPDFVDRRGVVFGFGVVLRRGVHSRDGQRPARESLGGPQSRRAGPRRQLGSERRAGRRDRTGQQRRSIRHAAQSSKSCTLSQHALPPVPEQLNGSAAVGGPRFLSLTTLDDFRIRLISRAARHTPGSPVERKTERALLCRLSNFN